MSEQTKFTQGEWTVIDESERGRVKGLGFMVMAVGTPIGNARIAEVITQADANLVAAAPILYAALESLLKFNEELCQDVGVSTNYPSATKARKALAKARGEQP